MVKQEKSLIEKQGLIMQKATLNFRFFLLICSLLSVPGTAYSMHRSLRLLTQVPQLTPANASHLARCMLTGKGPFDLVSIPLSANYKLSW